MQIFQFVSTFQVVPQYLAEQTSCVVTIDPDVFIMGEILPIGLRVSRNHGLNADDTNTL